MHKVRLEDVADEEDIKMHLLKTDITYFEKFCGSCDHFNIEDECPFYGKVLADTEWNYYTHMVNGVHKKCEKFWD